MSSFSCEKNRTTSYSNDLRWRIVWHILALGHSYGRTAMELCISMGTVHNIMNIFRTSGDVMGKIQPSREHLRTLADYEELFVVGFVLHNPCIQQREVCSTICQATGTEVSIYTICRVLKKYGFTRKKYNQLQFKDALCLEADLWQKC